MKLYLKHKRKYHEFATFDDFNEFFEANDSAIQIDSVPKRAKVEFHKSGETKRIYFTSGEPIEAFNRDGFQSDCWNLIVEGDTKKQWEARVVEAGLPLKKAKNYLSQFKSKGWIEIL